MFPDLLRDDVFRLETKRLWLRWPRASDAAEIARLADDAGVAEMTARIPHPYPADAASAFVLRARRENAEGKSAIFAVTAKRRPTLPLGIIALENAGERRLMLGYWLGKPYWGRGMGTEGVSAMVDFAFTWTVASEIVAATRLENAASQRILEKSGFRFVEQTLDETPARTSPLLCNHYALQSSDWHSRQAAAHSELSLEGL